MFKYEAEANKLIEYKLSFRKSGKDDILTHQKKKIWKHFSDNELDEYLSKLESLGIRFKNGLLESKKSLDDLIKDKKKRKR